MNVYVLFKNLLFLSYISWIFFSEIMLYYLLFKSYDESVRSIINRLAKQNILYVKIFQALALNNNLLDDQNSLLRFADNAPWSKKDIDYSTLIQIESDFDISILNNYSPINSGMISLVFKGIKRDTNEQIVIKMKRRNIEYLLNDGIEKILFCLYLFSFIPIINNYKISEVIHNNIDLIRHQTNFALEIQNMQQMKHNCRRLKYIKIPNSYPEITNKYSNVIVMEYVEGKTIHSVLPQENEIYAKLVFKFVLVTLFMNGICHGDLHVGNILFINDDSDPKYKHKLCILDFGIIYKIDKIRNALFYIFSNMCILPPHEIATNTLLCGIIEPVSSITKLPKQHYDNLINIVTDFINDTVHVSGKLTQINIFKVFFDLNEYMENNRLIVDNFNLYASDDLIRLQVIFAMLHGVVLKLCKNKYIELANQVMIETFQIDVSES